MGHGGLLLRLGQSNDTTTLAYESGADRLRRAARWPKVRSVLIHGTAFVCLVVATWRFMPAAWEAQANLFRLVHFITSISSQRDAAFAQCLTYQPSPDDELIFDEGVDKEPAAQPGYLRGWTYPVFRYRATRAEPADGLTVDARWPDRWAPDWPTCLLEYERLSAVAEWRTVKHQLVPRPGLCPPTHTCYRSLAFLHARAATPAHPPRLVIVTFDGPRFTREDAHPFSVRVLRRAGETAWSSSEFTFSTDPTLPVRLFTGEPDPADASHFTIRYEAGGVPGTIDGWLRADDTVTLQVRDGPGKRGE